MLIVKHRALPVNSALVIGKEILVDPAGISKG
jgi:hypothetical protein